MADETEQGYSRDELQDFYKKVHIYGNEKDIKELNHHGRKYLSSVKFSDKFVILPFDIFLEEILTNSSDRTVNVFSEIQKGFLNLQKYGIKLLQCPWRKEYYSIKLYTPFFKHHIEPRIPSHLASSILCLYGYKQKAKDVLELKEPVKSFDSINATAFELFLGAIELEVMFDIVREVEQYTDEFVLTDIIKARQRTVGDVREARKYLCKSKGLHITKRRKLDKDYKSDDLVKDKEDNEGSSTSHHGVTSRSFPLPPESPTSQTTYSPGLTDYTAKGYKSVVGSAKAKHVGSSNGVGLISDEELYGLQQGQEVSLSDAELYGVPEYQAMEVEHEPEQSQYYSVRQSDNYIDMSANNNADNYEIMARQAYNLPQPPNDREVLPPPTYSEAVNHEDWEIIPDPVNQKEHDVSNTLPGLSGLNISENGVDFGEGVVIKDHRFPNPETKKYRGNVHCGHAEVINMELLNSKGKSINDSTTVTTTVSYSSSSLRDKTAYTKTSDSQSSNGYGKLSGETQRVPGDSVVHMKNEKDLPTFPYQHSRDYRDMTALDPSSKRGTSQRNDHLSGYTASTKPAMSTVMFPPSSNSQSSTSTETLSRDVLLSQSTSREALLSQSTSREALLSQSTSRDILLPQSGSNRGLETNHTQTSPDTHKHLPRKEPQQNVCVMCPNTATHYCSTCSKQCCLNCTNILNRLMCDGPRIHHIVERSRPSSSREKDSLKQDTCVNCKKPSTHECRICKIKCCSVCQHVGMLKDQCTTIIGHVFVSTKSDMTPFNGLSLDKEIQKDLNEPNICDQCGMIATFICADCHNRVCKVCLDIFKKDLCTATKKEHFFHLIIAQTKRTDTKQAESWSCKRCTYRNPPENSICSMCATSQGISGVEYPESGSRRCGSCTYGNKEGARICAMCHQTLGLDKAESYL